MKEVVEQLLHEQLESWSTAKLNYEALEDVRVNTFVFNGCSFVIQFNPARIVSSAAKVDSLSIKERKCFLCSENRPSEQNGLVFGTEYIVLVNPFPIFPKHLTVPSLTHCPQLIKERIGDMMDLAKNLTEYIVFYNGPRCGASAPDHVHFQAGNKGFLPFEGEWKDKRELILQSSDACLWTTDEDYRPVFIIESSDRDSAIHIFNTIYNVLKNSSPEDEPMMNLLAWYEDESWIICLFPRQKHRPDCFAAEGDAKLMISPASVDLGGVFITPLEKDFDKITIEDIISILKEVCISVDDKNNIIQRIKELL